MRGVPVLAQWLTNPTRNHEVAGLIPGLAVSCGVGGRQGSDPALLWLWHQLAAIAPIRPLAWEPPYAAGAAQEKTKKKGGGAVRENVSIIERKRCPKMF